MFATGDPEIGAALNSGVIGDNHTLAAFDHTDPGNDAGTRRHALVHVQSGQFAEFKKRRTRIDQAFNALARQNFAFFDVSIPHLLRSTNPLREPKRMQFVDFFAILRVVLAEIIRSGVEEGFHFRHGKSGYSLRTKATLAAPGFSKVSAATR